MRPRKGSQMDKCKLQRLSDDGTFDLFIAINSKIVHARHRKGRALCRQNFGWIMYAKTPRGTENDVTCKKCLAVLQLPA